MRRAPQCTHAWLRACDGECGFLCAECVVLGACPQNACMHTCSHAGLLCIWCSAHMLTRSLAPVHYRNCAPDEDVTISCPLQQGASRDAREAQRGGDVGGHQLAPLASEINIGIPLGKCPVLRLAVVLILCKRERRMVRNCWLPRRSCSTECLAILCSNSSRSCPRFTISLRSSLCPWVKGVEWVKRTSL